MRGIKTSVISIVAIGLLAGSTVGVAAQEEEAGSAASAGCDAPLVEPGVYDGLNDFDDAAQAYRVVVPQGYADLAPAPLLLWLSSGGGSVDNFILWEPYLGAVESIFVVAEQTRNKHRETSTLTALIDQLVVEYCIDPQRIHAMGQSSSARAAGDFACAASERIASLSIGVGSFRPDCQQRLVPLMAMTGDRDRGPVTRSVELWAEAYECNSDPIVEDLGSGVTRTAYQGCGADIVLYDVEGAGHDSIRHECLRDWNDSCYQNDVFDELSEVERFSAEHPLPAAE